MCNFITNEAVLRTADWEMVDGNDDNALDKFVFVIISLYFFSSKTDLDIWHCSGRIKLVCSKIS